MEYVTQDHRPLGRKVQGHYCMKLVTIFFTQILSFPIFFFIMKKSNQAVCEKLQIFHLFYINMTLTFGAAGMAQW